MENTIYLLRGLPGAGKTSLANTLIDLYTSDLYSAVNNAADDYHYENGPNPGEYDFNPKAMGYAHKQCQSRTMVAMDTGTKCVIVSNTLTTEKEIKPYLEMAEKFGYKVVSLVVENRHGNKSVHNVPDEALEKMSDRFTLKLT